MPAKERMTIVTYNCSTCDKQFIYRRNKLDHERTHGELMPYTCCGLEFPSKRRLKRHRKVHNVSKKLSEVLDDIGINENIVMRKRRGMLLSVSLSNVYFTVDDDRMCISQKWYVFGSQVEGTTSLGLDSDSDFLICNRFYNVIQNIDEWQKGSINYLEVKENTSPGYCKLQRLRSDKPLPDTDVPDENHVMDERERVLLTHSFIYGDVDELFLHGPAMMTKGKDGYNDQDIVRSFHCKSWPDEGTAWLDQDGVWPSEELKKQSKKCGHFLVPVGPRGSDNDNLQWRISTNEAEQCLVFSFNISQIRCYFLMKITLKSFINPQCPDVISSYMCKTTVFHCIRDTNNINWTVDNLCNCLNICLQKLHDFVQDGCCPHFIIPGNNLMTDRISQNDREKLLSILQELLQSNGSFLFKVKIDAIGLRLQAKLMELHIPLDNSLNWENKHKSAELEVQLAVGMQVRISKYLARLANKTLAETRGHLLLDERLAISGAASSSENSHCYRLLRPLIMSCHGSVLASCYLSKGVRPSAATLTRLRNSIDSDVSSGRLKVASVLYCMGEFDGAEKVLSETNELFEKKVIQVYCCCYPHVSQPATGFIKQCDDLDDESVVQSTVAFCVRFLPQEVHCVPHELKYELYKYAKRLDRTQKNKADFRSCFAAIDSLSYIYFLQYKVYGQIGRRKDRIRVLDNLKQFTESKPTDPSYGHIDTALNLLGQCLVQENRIVEALWCYIQSLKRNPTNNAARYLVCILLCQEALRNCMHIHKKSELKVAL